MTTSFQLNAAQERLTRYYHTLTNEQSKLGVSGYRRLLDDRVQIMKRLSECMTRRDWELAQRLAWVLINDTSFLRMQGYWKDMVVAIESGLAATKQLNHRQDEGAFLGTLGNAYHGLGQVEKAIAYYQEAITIAQEVGYRQGEGNHLGNMGLAYRDLGQLGKAIMFYQQAITIAQEIGDRQGEGNRLDNLGNVYRTLGQVEKAMECYEQALTIAQEIGHRQGEGNRLGNVKLRP